MNGNRLPAMLLAATCFAVVPAVAFGDDLISIVTQTMDYDAGVAEARADAAMGRQAVPRARAGLLPRIDGGWGRAYNRIAVQGLPGASYWQNGWTVSLTQPLFDWGRLMNYRQAGTVEARGEVEWVSRQQDLLVRTARAYFDELAAEDELHRADDYVQAVAAQRDVTLRKRAGGEATVIDLREVEALLESARLQQMDARSKVEMKQQALGALTGRPSAPLSRLADPGDGLTLPHLEPDDVGLWVAQAEAKSYPVQLGQLDLLKARYEIEKVRAQQYPVVNLTGSYTPAGAASGYAEPATTTVAMVSVSIPLFAGGEMKANLREAHAGEDKANAALLASRRQAGANTRESFTRFHWAVDRAARLARLVQANARSLAAVQIGYRVGSRTDTDVVRAFDALYTSRRDARQALYDTFIAFLELKAGTASLGIDDIAAINAQLVGSGVAR